MSSRGNGNSLAIRHFTLLVPGLAVEMYQYLVWYIEQMEGLCERCVSIRYKAMPSGMLIREVSRLRFCDAF